MARPGTEELMALRKQKVFHATVICATDPSLGITSPQGPLSASFGQLNHGDSIWTLQQDGL